MPSLTSPGDCRICTQPLFANVLLRQHNLPRAAQGLPAAGDLATEKGVTLSLYQCSGCGLIQHTEPPVPYWRDVIRAAGISPEMREYRLDQFGKWLRTHNLIGHKVLEVGCGQGEYLALIEQSGANAFGVEHNFESVLICRSAGLRAQQTFIEGPRTKIDNGPFDGFAILNFLEHIPTAHATLQGISANLSDGATGLVEVPNFDMILQSGLFAEFITDHLYYFSQQTLTTLLESNGFDVLDCSPSWHNYVLSATVRKRFASLIPRVFVQVFAQTGGYLGCRPSGPGIDQPDEYLRPHRLRAGLCALQAKPLYPCHPSADRRPRATE
jgi:SAM-dependent methyltransferase